MNDAHVMTISERRRIREERQRADIEGFREDVANLCKCPNCGEVHYRPRSEAEVNEKVK